MSVICSVLKGIDTPRQSKPGVRGGGRVQDEAGVGVVWLPTAGFGLGSVYDVSVCVSRLVV